MNSVKLILKTLLLKTEILERALWNSEDWSSEKLFFQTIDVRTQNLLTEISLSEWWKIIGKQKKILKKRKDKVFIKANQKEDFQLDDASRKNKRRKTKRQILWTEFSSTVQLIKSSGTKWLTIWSTLKVAFMIQVLKVMTNQMLKSIF